MEILHPSRDFIQYLRWLAAGNKPRIRRRPSGFGIWACESPEAIGLGYSPANAYSAWWRNLIGTSPRG